MTVDWLLLHHEDYVCESWIVYDCSHVAYEAIYRLIINFVFFKFTDVEDAYVVEPFAPVEPSKNEKLFGPDHAGSVPLSTSWSLFEFQRVAPSHGFCIQNVKVV